MGIRVLVADDHRLILRAVRRVLERTDDIEIVGEARRGSQVLPLLSQLKPDLCLLDVRMPEMDGLDVRRADPQGARRCSHRHVVRRGRA